MAGRAALVIGGANTVWADVEAALEIGEFDGVVACNDVGALWPGPLDGWATLHPEKLRLWVERRSRNGYPPAAEVFQYEHRTGLAKGATRATEYRFPGQQHSGSSGLFALKVALVDLGFERAVLCGVPMSSDLEHFYETKPWRGAMSHQRGWNEVWPQIGDRARSMSGWTRERMGEPDKEWLGG